VAKDVTAIAVDREEFVKRCEEVYAKNRENLERQYEGKVVALYDEGVAAISENVDSAYREAVKKHPDKLFYFRRVGKFASGMLF